MEAAGIAVDEGVLEAERPLLERRLAELEAAAAELAGGTPFNLGSPQARSCVGMHACGCWSEAGRLSQVHGSNQPSLPPIPAPATPTGGQRSAV